MDEFNTIFNDENNNMNITDIIENEVDDIYIVDNSKDSKNKNTRFLNIIYYLGLNSNINYPLHIIINGIIELHTYEEKKTHYHSYYKFNTSSISQEIKKNLFDFNKEKYSSYEISRAVKRAYHYYNLDNVVYKYSINSTKKQKINVLGFNYNNPRWVPLNSYDIE